MSRDVIRRARRAAGAHAAVMVVACLAWLAGCGTGDVLPDAGPDVTDASIAFWEARLVRHPDDLLTPSALASHYLSRFADRRDMADVGRAGRTLTDGLSHHQGHGPFLRGLAAVHIARHEFPEALTAARMAYDVEPRRAANGVLFDAYFETGRYDSARVVLERMDPDGFAYLIRLARYAATVGQPATAARALARACRREGLTSRSLRAWCSARRVDLATASAAPRDVRRVLGRAVRDAPGNTAVRMALARATYADGSLDEARRLFASLAGRAGGEEAYLWLARIARRHGDGAAAARYRARFEAIVRDPRYGRAYWAPLAEMMAESGRLDEALALARRDLEQRPGPEAWHTVATILFGARRLSEAREAVAQAQRWSPDNPALIALRDSIDRFASQ